MANIGLMNYFKINECGLYKVNNPKSFGLDLNETFQLLMNWKKPLVMSSTIPWNPASRSAKSKCYCKDIYKDESTGDFLVVLWKSDTDTTGSLLGAQENSIDGSEEVFKFGSVNKGKKVIWGRPCYYWVIPEKNTVVSIKFDHSVCDSALFQEYISACVTNKIPHPDKLIDYTNSHFARLSFKDSKDNYRYSYRFDMSLKTLDTINSALTKLTNVTHIIRRETIQNKTVIDERAIWLKLFDAAIPYPKAAQPKLRQIEIKAEANPSPTEIKQIIENYLKNKENPDTKSWDNVGFETPSGRYWSDTFRLKDQLVITNSSAEVFTAKFLLAEINKSRKDYLLPLEKSDSKTAIKG